MITDIFAKTVPNDRLKLYFPYELFPNDMAFVHIDTIYVHGRTLIRRFFEEYHILPICLLGDVSIKLEFMENPSTPPVEPRAVSSRIDADGAGKDCHQSNDCLDREPLDGTSEIISGGGLDPENARSEFDHIQIKLKNSIFGKGFLQLPRNQIFLNLPD